MDPDGDYESRHSTRSAADDVNLACDDIDVESPSKIFVPDEDTKLPAKPTKSGDAYKGATAPPMEGPPLVADAAGDAAAARSSIEPHGTAYDDMMDGKMNISAAPDEAPISNSVAVPIGFDSDDMALPEAKALPIISSTANEGTKMPSAMLDEVDAEEGAEPQVDEEEPTPVPVPSPSDEEQSSTNPETTSERDLDEQSGQDAKVPSPKKCTRKCKLCFVAVAFVAILGIVLGVLFGTARGQLLLKGYTSCHVEYPGWIDDGWCDSGEYNTAECGWDGGDCVEFNEQYPFCRVTVHVFQIGNGDCDGGDYNTAECGWDGGDCVVDGYPDCHVEYPERIGNGICNGGEDYNNAKCGWDGGDCLIDGYPHCHVEHPYLIGDGHCDGGSYNTAECGWDGGDCFLENNYPNCKTRNWEPNLEWIGDGYCNGGNYNTAKCGWDGGDCLVVGLPDCHVDQPQKIGNGQCDDGKRNTAECGWDGGDCLVNEYPNCHVDIPNWIGDGQCNGGRYNTAECGWDGGDCFLENYPNCKTDKWVPNLEWIADGFCNGGRYNTAQCGWDGGDCHFRRHFNQECIGIRHSTKHGMTHEWCQNRCIDLGIGCEAYDFSENPQLSKTGTCRIFGSYYSPRQSSGQVRYACWEKELG